MTDEDAEASPDGEARGVAPFELLRIKAGEREKIDEPVVSERTLVVSTPGETIARLQYLPGGEKALAARETKDFA